VFHFFSKKPSLREILPTDFIDIHSHLLYGIDDGATNPEHSIQLVREIMYGTTPLKKSQQDGKKPSNY
jgi:protein-tyrosine phosphatase